MYKTFIWINKIYNNNNNIIIIIIFKKSFLG